MSLHPNSLAKKALLNWHGIERKPYTHIEVRRLTPTLGAEVHGVDLSKDISNAQFSEIRRAMHENLVVAFRNQQLTREQHKAFVRRFGTLHRHALAKARQESSKVLGDSQEFDPDVLAWKTTKDSEFTAGEGWHNDVSCDAHPIWGSFLHVTRLPQFGGGDTAFANNVLAYESLSPAYQQFLEGLTAVHDGALPWTIGYGTKPEAGKTFPTATHPVVAKHPFTGQKFLYVNSGFTSHIVELSTAESTAVLQHLYQHIEKNPHFQVRVKWEPGTLLFWDNWAVQHRAIWDYYPEDRWGERVSAVLNKGPQSAR